MFFSHWTYDSGLMVLPVSYQAVVCSYLEVQFLYLPVTKTRLRNNRSSYLTCSIKKVFLEISQNSQENTCARVSFLNKVEACNFIKKETLAQVLSCEFCQISKNTFLTEHLCTTASVISFFSKMYLQWKWIAVF